MTGSTHQVHHKPVEDDSELMKGKAVTVQLRCGVMQANRMHQREQWPQEGTIDRVLFHHIRRVFQETLETKTLKLPTLEQVLGQVHLSKGALRSVQGRCNASK